VSIHGRAALGGIYSAATCNDCHSTGGDAHKILPPGNIESTINHFNITQTCGKCHRYIAQDYKEGIHGELTARGEVESPICTTCHGEHNILLTDDPRSPVSPSRVAEATCSPCHESAALNEKYSLPTGRLHSFRDSYHGLKSKAGDVTVANCASCHGAHRILPSTDSTSTIHPSNLQETCGGCHPSITPEMAQTPIHESATGAQTGVAGVVRKIYIIAIVLIIGSMVLHWLLDLRRQIGVVMKQKKQIRRMDPDEVVQHFFLALSFTILVITGFSLRFYDAWWSEWLFGWEGGYTFRGTLHRVAGAVMLVVSLWHVLYLLTARGRRFLKDIWPKTIDVKQFFQTMKYNVGASKDHPKFGRFSYVEKAEYWALVWGTVVMGITGIFLWFDNLAVQWFPKGFLDVALIIHYYEAWLAFLAILIWHMYSTVFSPRVYPMNPSWLTGKMPVEQYEAEHPLAMPVKEEEPRKEGSLGGAEEPSRAD
ncbi:MAG: cytochrome B, partial [Candidatus Eisenbacteria bacterium]|nr:cytochrome B [Candidatus Eisenbacteria bacterium]